MLIGRSGPATWSANSSNAPSAISDSKVHSIRGPTIPPGRCSSGNLYMTLLQPRNPLACHVLLGVRECLNATARRVVSETPSRTRAGWRVWKSILRRRYYDLERLGFICFHRRISAHRGAAHPELSANIGSTIYTPVGVAKERICRIRSNSPS